MYSDWFRMLPMMVVVMLLLLLLMLLLLLGSYFPDSAPHCAKSVWDGGLKASPILLAVGP